MAKTLYASSAIPSGGDQRGRRWGYRPRAPRGTAAIPLPHLRLRLGRRLVLPVAGALLFVLPECQSLAVSAFPPPPPPPAVFPFASFEFAPDGVCTTPSVFAVESGSSSSHSNNGEPSSFTMRNVPGGGDCMFLAVALATAASTGVFSSWWGDEALLRAVALETRHVVASVFESSIGDGDDSDAGRLVVTADQSVRAADLLRQAAAELRVPPTDYVRQLRTEGRDGGLYGGGPELTVLANVLRRPISIYELAAPPPPVTPTTTAATLTGAVKGSATAAAGRRATTQAIVCRGVFGEGTFADPLLSAARGVFHSAVLRAAPHPTVGAAAHNGYGWHLHILVVDASAREKHACVLFPHTQGPSARTP